ncbi:MAG: aminotransferase class I/II-fold pyridoxal phosphate-dependent enzyme [Chloroflexota bacterium]
MKPIASRITLSSGKGAFDIWEKAVALEAQGLDVIHLEIGEPDFGTPTHIIDEAERAMRAGRTTYTSTAGTPSLRDSVAEYLSSTRQIDVNPANILAGPGVKGVMYAAMMSLIEAGDEMLVPDPGYPLYQSMTSLAGGVNIPYPLTGSNHFLPDPELLESLITPKTKVLMLNSPGNPTGTIQSKALLKKIAAIVEKHDLWVLSDEIYAQIYLRNCFPNSIATEPGMLARTVIMDGCSKAYGMTGWRIGFGLFPEPLVKPAKQIMVHTHSCLPPFVMDAAEVAFNGPQDGVKVLRDTFRSRADQFYARIEQINHLSAIKPDGAFYMMVDTSAFFEGDDRQFADRLLDEQGVAVLPGSGMGGEGRGFVRIALTQPMERLDLALGRIKTLVDQIEAA